MTDQAPRILICKHRRPLVSYGLVAVLGGYTAAVCGGVEADRGCFGPDLELVIRCARSTHAPLPELCRCMGRPEVRTLFVSEGWLETEEAVQAAGLRGYLGPGCTAEQLREAVHTVLSGGFFYHPGTRRAPAIGLLTGRQVEVLRLIGSGHSDQEIAERLGVAEPTVRHHLKRLLTRLGLERRGELSALAAQGGLVARREPELPIRGEAPAYEHSLAARVTI